MTDENRQHMAQIYGRLGRMYAHLDRATVGYHLGFAVLIVAIGALDAWLRMTLGIETAGPMAMALYAGFLGAGLAVTVSYGCLLVHVVGNIGVVQSGASIADTLKAGLLSSLLVVPPTLAGLCCCVFPGVAVACLLAPAPILVILRRYPVRRALSRAIDIARNHPLTMLPVWLIVAFTVVVPLVFDAVAVLVVATAIDPDTWLRTVGPAVRWLAGGTFGLTTIWALTATIPIVDDRV